MATLRPTFDITIGSLQSTSERPVGQPLRIGVSRSMDTAADGFELALGERSGVAAGDAVRVQLGHDGTNAPVFRGEVALVRPAISGVLVRAVGTANALLCTRVAGFFENQPAGAIIRDLAGRAGIAVGTIEQGPLLPRFAVDSRMSIYAHLRALAERLGCELYTDRDGMLQVKSFGAAAGALGGLGDAAAGAAGALVGSGTEGYVYGQHLLSAAASVRLAPWGTIEVGGESPVSGQGTTTAHWLTANDGDYRGAAGDGAPQLLVLDPAARTKDLADSFAQGLLARASRRNHEVAICVLGRPQVDLGDTIAISGLADDLANTRGYIRALEHQFSAARGFVSTLRIAAT